MSSNDVTFALVQYPVVKGSIEQNLKKHIEYVELAAKNSADIVVFPELSLTGYEPELAGELAVDTDSELIKRLSVVSQTTGVIIVCGCPLKSNESRPFIGAMISFPSGKTEFCHKQYLHTGESDYFVAGEDSYIFDYEGQRIALAICADFSNPAHARNAKMAGADVYLSSVLISEGGFDTDSQQLRGYASTHHFAVLMSNHNGETGGWKTCGKSRAWDRNGELGISSDTDDSALIISTVSAGKVTGKVLKI